MYIYIYILYIKNNGKRHLISHLMVKRQVEYSKKKVN